MIFKEDVCMWFKSSEAHHRLGLLCGLLNMCVPLELRYIRTFLDDLSKRDDMLKDSHVRANSAKDVIQIGKFLDQRTCSKLIVYIALLDADNQSCSKLLYEKVLACCMQLENDITVNHPNSEVLIAQLLLLYTLILNHPAFTCEVKRFIGEKLTALQQVQERFKLSKNGSWPKPNHVEENCTEIVPQQKNSCHLSQGATRESNQNTEACDSGLSIGTEPEGEVLSDHSCVPLRAPEQSIIIPSKVGADTLEVEKEYPQKWCAENNGCVKHANSFVRPHIAHTAPTVLPPVNSIPPVQGALSSSSGESLNLCSEPSSVPTTYIYNSSILERNALNKPVTTNARPVKKKLLATENQLVNHKPQKLTSNQNSPMSSPYVSPPQSLNPSRVASPKGAATITTFVTSAPHQAAAHSLSSAITHPTICKSMPKPPIRQSSTSSSSGSSYPSSPALANTISDKRNQPTTSKRLTFKEIPVRPPVTLPINFDLGNLKSGSYSNTIAFFPPLDSADESQLGMDGLSNCIPVSSEKNHKVVTSSATVPTTTVTTTVAHNENLASFSSVGRTTKSGDSKNYHSTVLENKANDRKDAHNASKTRNPLCNGVVPAQQTVNGSNVSNGFPLFSNNYRLPVHNYYLPPPMLPEPNLATPPPINQSHTKNNDCNIIVNGAKNEKLHKDSSSETSPSSSSYSSPPQTPSPDINSQGSKSSKKTVSDAGEDTWDSTETAVVYNVPPPVVGSNGENGTPPPGPQSGTFPTFVAQAQQHRVNRYMPYPGTMGFLGYPPQVYRYPLPSPVMFGPRAPVPLSGSEKSSREATPPNVAQSELAPKGGDVTIPPHSPSVSSGGHSRGSNSASPPSTTVQDLPMSHGPPLPVPPTVPYSPANYQMYAAPYFAPYASYMPGHSSVANNFVSPHSVPPSYSLPHVNADFVYPGAYSVMNPYPSANSTGPTPPYNQYPVHLHNGPPTQALRAKKSATCYNCGQVGHRGSECNEASMLELTRSRSTQVSGVQN